MEFIINSEISFPKSSQNTDFRYKITVILLCQNDGYSLVEPRGIEPLSESNLERASPGAVCYLHSLIPAGTNTLRESVASWCMVWAKLTIRTVSTQITPEPGSWTFRGGWAPNQAARATGLLSVKFKRYPFYRGQAPRPAIPASLPPSKPVRPHIEVWRVECGEKRRWEKTLHSPLFTLHTNN